MGISADVDVAAIGELVKVAKVPLAMAVDTAALVVMVENPIEDETAPGRAARGHEESDPEGAH